MVLIYPLTIPILGVSFMANAGSFIVGMKWRVRF